MAGIILRTTKRRGVLDVYNRVTLINDIFNGNDRELNRKIGIESAKRTQRKIREVDDAHAAGH